MTTYLIQRTGDVPLKVEGRLLAEVSTERPNATRWLEVRVYATDSGRWVTETVGRSLVLGEVDRCHVVVCSTPDEVRDGLRRTTPGETERYLTRQARLALIEAAEQDGRLKDALIENV
jgi:hypothetical protein